jgi:orotate phosphoribosyltransferase
MNYTTESNSKTAISSRRVADDLLTLDAVQFNVQSPFTWVSGIKSPVYCDNRKVISDVVIRNRMVEAFIEIINEHFPNVEVIAGVATGGMPMGTLIADRLELPFIYVRQEAKEHGLKRQVEGAYKAGDKVILIEDHISTGSSSLKAVEGLRKEGLDVIALISIMTYGFKKASSLFESNKIEQWSLCDLETIIDVCLTTNRISQAEADTILEFKNSK